MKTNVVGILQNGLTEMILLEATAYDLNQKYEK